MRRALRAWLWLLFIWDFCSLLGNSIPIFQGGFTFSAMAVFFLNTISFVAVLILLFTNKKAGFYIMCLSTALGVVYNLYVLFCIVKHLMKFQIIMSVLPIILSLAVPAVTYVFLAKDWKDME